MAAIENEHRPRDSLTISCKVLQGTNIINSHNKRSYTISIANEESYRM